MTDPYALFEEARKQGPNPFRLKTAITDQEVWGEIIADLPSLNQHIDQKIHQAISEVRQQYSSKVGIAIKGDRGTGKSHAIRRIWKQIEQEGRAVFAYIPPCPNPNHIDLHVRFYLADSFIHQDVCKISQWQKLATAVLATLKGTIFEEKYQQFLEKTDKPDELKKIIITTIEETKLLNFLAELAEAILDNTPGLDFQFVTAVLCLIFKNNRRAQAALSWIKGEDNSDIKELVNLPSWSAEQQKDKSVWMIQQICKLAEVASLPVIICFDQLDSAQPDIERGDSSAQTVARCIDRIYFESSNVIFLCCVISDTWREIDQMGGGIPDRVGQRSVTANPPTAEQMIELVKLRLNWFFKNKSLNYNDYPSLYPFEESQIRNIARKGAGVRSLLEECAKNFEFVGNTDKSKEKNKKKFMDIYNELLQQLSIPIDADDELAASIACNMKMIPEGGTNYVVITRIEPLISTAHDLHLLIYGYDALHKKEVKIGVRVCETTNGKTFTAVMKRLLDYSKHNITRGCLVRSKNVPPHWRGNQLKQQFIEQNCGKVVSFNPDTIKSLVALEKIYKDAGKYDFEKDEVVNFVKELRLAADNPLICDILSAPI